MHLYLYLYLLYQYPGFYSYTEGATWKILDLLTETFLISSADMEIVHCPKNIFAERFNSKQPPIPMKFGPNKNHYPLLGLFREKTVKTLYGWISCLALTASITFNPQKLMLLLVWSQKRPIAMNADI